MESVPFRLVEDEGGGAECDDRPVLNADTVLGAEQSVHEESARDAVIVAQGIDRLPLFVTFHVDVAVAAVQTRVVAFDGDVDFVAFVAASYQVVSLVEGEHLLVGEHILDDHDVSPVFRAFPFVYLLLAAARRVQSGLSDADAELLVAVVADEHQRLSCLVFCLVELDVMVTFGASYSFHDLFGNKW